ncbi:beta-galactosidase/beta-glucuronidase [Microbacterium testaceum StLB037]|uniref:beta-mannosidase n=1 Tax=Microbacterium testaceum (strain StLB037) TaxID=979556 RepID=E8N9V4_MICTS|nr:beta-galactosidase/beta-glucuronidase [Microbacterium testaceum]BAJ74573.1 beta-galactosidase/beta-glucuronidase [Microbacterium testaceum StLB037]
MLTRITTEPLWLLRSLSGPVPEGISGRTFDAPVPGDVHMALRDAGAIPDPFDDDNEHRLSWIGRSDWEYRTTLPRVGGTPERIDVVFHGVDTHATVAIDGAERARLTNMHRTWRVPAPELAAASAELCVALRSPVAAAEAERDRLGARWTVFSSLSPFIRKNACAFGWDWGPSLPGSGIWREVEVEAWSTARLSAVRPTVGLLGADGVVSLDIELERTERTGRDADLGVLVEVGGARTWIPAPARAERLRGELVVRRPELWWPTGMGRAALHELTVTLVDTHGTALDVWTQHIGFRDLVVEQVPDGEGRGFGLTVNGIPLFVRGFNWIPDDTSPARVTASDIRRRIAETLDLGANLLRVWGGGVFESDDFYRACDEAGILVWQDFLFACAAYPEEEPFTTEVEAEARENITRLMSHPSLALWNGNNENLWFWFLHDWEHKLDGATWGEGFYIDLLPRLVAELDPARAYLVGSPSSGGRWDEPNDPSRGIVHWWIPDDYRAYDDVRPRFVSEFGFQGPPARATFDAVVHDASPAPFSPGSVQRQKAEGGTERINDVLDAHFGVPHDFDEWYWLAQLDQARAVRYGIERFRTLEPFCRGTIVWQLNDCWPALSWSMIDVADRYKPVAYAVREAYRPRIVVLRHEDGSPTLFACNSTAEPWDATIDAQRWTRGCHAAGVTLHAHVPAHTAIEVPLGALATGLAGDELLVATVGTTDATDAGDARPVRSVLLGGTDREYPDSAPRFDVQTTPAPDGVVVRLTADTLLRDATLLVDRIDPDAHVDRTLETLLPGESADWHVRTTLPASFTVEAVRAALHTARAATARDDAYRGLAQLEAEKQAAPTG